MEHNKAIILSRVSTVQQDLEQQTNVLISDAKSKGYDESSIIIIEDKESAIKLEEQERNGLNDMKRLIERGGIDCIFIWEITRISRQLPMLYSIRDYLQAHHVQLYCHTPDFTLFESDWTISSTSNMVFAMYSVFAENEMRTKKERFARGKAHAKSMGRAITKVAYGYTTAKDKTVIPDPTKSAIVKSIFTSYNNENISITNLAKRLYSNGTFMDMKIASIVTKIVHIMNNDCYIGRAPYPAIISKDLWDKVHIKMKQRKLEMSKTSFKTSKTTALCKDIIFMAGTNYHLGLCGNYYQSRSSKHNHPDNMPTVRVSVIDPLALNVAIRISKQDNDSKVVVRKLEAQEQEIHKMKLVVVYKMQQLRQQIDKLEERIILGKISETKAEQIEARLIEEYNDLEIQHNQFEEQTRQIHEQISNVATSGDIDYDNLTTSDKVELIHNNIKRIEIIRIKKSLLRINIQDKYDNWFCFNAESDRYHKDIIELP